MSEEPKKPIILHVEDKEGNHVLFRDYLTAFATINGIDVNKMLSHVVHIKSFAQAKPFITDHIRDIAAIYTDNFLIDGKHAVDVMKNAQEAAKHADVKLPKCFWASSEPPTLKEMEDGNLTYKQVITTKDMSGILSWKQEDIMEFVTEDSDTIYTRSNNDIKEICQQLGLIKSPYDMARRTAPKSPGEQEGQAGDLGR